MKSGKEFKECKTDSDCVTQILDKQGNVIKEGIGECKTVGPNGYHCYPSSSSKQWKNYVKAFIEVRDNIDKNKMHQSLIKLGELGLLSFSSELREKKLELDYYDMDDCVLDNLSVLVGSGFMKVSFTMIALLLFTIIA